jgi:NTE family protein
MSKNITRKKFFDAVDKLARDTFNNKIIMHFTMTLSPTFKKYFAEADFVETDARTYTKEMRERYAIAFGGGGARGSYAIGVWQVLDDLGFDFANITGTSIGAATGGMLLAGDVKRATEMWETIQTKKILEVEFAEERKNTSPQDMLRMISKMTRESIQNTGIKTAPIRDLIDEYYDMEKFKKSDKKLTVVVSEFPIMKERDIVVKDMPEAEWKDWMIASGSFFPAMQMTTINGVDYLDGGYRNNVPVDLLLNDGEKNIFSIDVKGPGFVKRVFPADDVSIHELSTLWNLGTVLIFSGNRSTQNIELGVLETKKYFGEGFGNWYTFDETDFEEKIQARVLHFFKNLEKENKLHFKRSEMYARLEKTYQKTVFEENFGVALLETLAKIFELTPVKAYSIDGMKKEILSAVTATEPDDKFRSLGEWITKYMTDFSLMGTKRQVLLIKDQLDKIPDEKNIVVQKIMDNFSVEILLAQLLSQIEKESGENNA